METAMQITRGFTALLLGVGAILPALTACSDNGNHPTGPRVADNDARASAAKLDDGTTRVKHNVRVVSATGDITTAVGTYRTLLGALNPNVAGEQPGGRREINWDGVPIGFTNNDLFPGNFFNVTSPRGVLFTTPGTGFHNTGQGFIEVNPQYDGEFNTFSPTKLFVARGSTIIDVQFVVAGSNTPATVTGFGSVFADVGRAHSTTIEYFDALGRSLLTVAAPRASDATGLSFVGAVFASRVVGRVRITAGDTPIDASVVDNVKKAGKKRDLVATDDFIYGEPRASK